MTSGLERLYSYGSK